MTLFDFAIVLYLAVNVALGFRFGFFRRLVHVAGFYIGMLLASFTSIGISQALGYGTGDHPAASHFGVYIGIIVFMVVVAEGLGAAYNSALASMNGMILDRFLGVALGAAATVFELGVMIYMFNNLLLVPAPSGTGQAPFITSASEQLHQSPLYKQIIRVQPSVLVVFLPVLPTEPRTYFSKTYI